MLTEKKTKRKLTRQLGFLGVFSIASGAMISSGLFILPGIAFEHIGPSVIIAYLIAGLFVLPTLLIKAELSTAMPKAGGDYFFIERSMGTTAGTIGGFASWFSLSLKSAFALVGIGAFATMVNPSFDVWEIKLIAAGFSIFFTILNLVSITGTKNFQIVLVIGLLTVLILYIIRGIPSVDVYRFKPFIIEGVGMHKIVGTAGLVFISFAGVTKIASVSEEVKNPTRNIPYGMLASFIVVLLLYVFTIFVTVGILDFDKFAGSLVPLSLGGSELLGNAGGIIMGIAAILAFFTTANAGILSSSRFLLAMSRDRILPKFLSNVTKKSNTPYISIIVTGAFMTGIILLLDIENLVKIASTMQLILFVFVILAGIIMRESKILNYKPTFKSPLYPWLHIAGVIVYSYLVYEMGLLTLFVTIGFMLACVIWAKFYFREENMRKFALIDIVERVIDKRLTSKSLTDELREILKERDEITEDRFDNMVKECEIMDIHKSINYDEFFSQIADKFSIKLAMEKEELSRMLIEREKESTTIIRPGLAIPHITIPGNNHFELVIARCTPGVVFNEYEEPVYALFILMGTKDERHFHLKSLSAIAQIAQNTNFDKDWLRAKNENELRDIILLSKRLRK
jgi:basic amino acid/polyamine antiporter, APA family